MDQGIGRKSKRAKHAFEVLPGSAWLLVATHLHPHDRIAFALTCRTFLDAVKGLPLRTETLGDPRFSLSWYQWVFLSFKRSPTQMAPQEPAKLFFYSKVLYDTDLMGLAARQGSIKAMKWLISRGIPLDQGLWHCADRAASGGHLDALKWLRSEGCELDASTCQRAAGGGYLDVLQWLRSQDPPCPWDAKACAAAARFGHLQVLQWLRNQDPPCDWDKWTCSSAAEGGHLQVLQWLRKQDPPCPWDSDTCSCAAAGGHLDVLKWARSQDPPCPWTEVTCEWAASYGHLQVLQWLRSQDPPCPWYPGGCLFMLHILGTSENKDIIDWVEQNRNSGT